MKQRVTYNVPGIPPAPVGRKLLQAVDYDYMDRKKRLAHRLPYYTKDEIARQKHSYHVVLMHEMMTAGYFTAVQELHKIFRKDDTDRNAVSGKQKHSLRPTLVSQRPVVELIAQTLKVCQDFTEQQEFEAPTSLRKNLGEKFMKQGEAWLAKHFLRSALESCEKMPSNFVKDKLEAEINCLLAFIARDNSDNLEEALESAVDYLVICRALSKEQSWQFKPKILSIRLKKPIALHGLRDEYEVVDGSSMTLYRVATLLEHEMLIGLANEILHGHRNPTFEELEQAHVFADNALRLAFEVRQPVALSSALMRFGVVLRHTGAFDDAISYFRQLAHHSEITGDQETHCIAFHNIAMCHMGKHESQAALMSLIKQKEVADMFKLEDLQADSLQELGLLMLQEGQEWEAEECYASAFESFDRLETKTKPPHSHTNNNFAMLGVASGLKLWARFAGLVRSERFDALCGLMEWKNCRAPLPSVSRPDYDDLAGAEELFHRYYQDPDSLVQKELLTPSSSPTEEAGSSELSPDSHEKRKAVGFRSKMEAKDEDGEYIVSPLKSDEIDDFASDYNGSVEHKELLTRKKRSIRRQSSMNKSLTVEMESRMTLSFPVV